MASPILTDNDIARLDSNKSGILTDDDITSFESGPNLSSSQPSKRKSIWSTVGAEITDQMRQEHPVLSGVAQAGQDIMSVPADYVNQRLLNYPRAALTNAGFEYPEAKDPNLSMIQKTGGIAGALQSGVGLTKAIGLGRKGDTAAQTMIKSGGLTAAYADTERPFDPMQKVTQFGLGFATAGMFKMAQGANNAINKAREGALDFLRKVRGAVFSRKRDIVNKFGDDLDNLANSNPDQAVSIRNSLEKLQMEIQGGTFGDVVIPPNTKIASIVNKSQTLKKFVQNPELADGVTLRESQAIINELKNKLPAMKKQGFNVNSDDIPLFDLIDDIRYDQLTAFPEMQQVRQTYGQMISKYNLIKYKIREGALKRNLINDFGDPEMKEAFDSLITEGLMKEVKGFKRTNQMLRMLGIAAKTVAIGGVGGAAGGAMFRGLTDSGR